MKDMNISRRSFLGGAFSFAALGFGRAFAVEPGSFSTGRPNLRVGVLSDIHVSHLPGTKGVKPFTHSSGECFLRVLELYRDLKVDAVLIAGDLTNYGDLCELQAVADIWKRVFPENRLPDGARVEPLVVYGNHDAIGFKFMHKKDYEGDAAKRAAMLELSIFRDPGAAYANAFGEPWAPVWSKTVKGYTFVGAHWGHEDEAPAFIRAHREELKGGKPFFYFQHPHPANTVYGTFAWGRDRGKTTEALAEFPNAVAFSGHSHYTLTDPHTIWQGAFTSVGTATLSHSGIPCYGMRVENHKSTLKSKEGNRMALVSRGRQGMVMEVYDDRIVLSRREYPADVAVGPDWVIPFAEKERPFRYDEQAKRMKAPEFPDGAKATARRIKGKLVKKDGAKESEAQIVVRFDGAVAREDPGRVFFYDVTGSVDGKKVKTRRVLADGYWHAASKLGDKGACVFPASDFPEDQPVEFSVRPLDAFLNAGRPITCTLKAS